MVQQSPAGYRPPLLARAHLRLALWTWQLNEHELRALDGAVIREVLADLRVASEVGYMCQDQGQWSGVRLVQCVTSRPPISYAGCLLADISV